MSFGNALVEAGRPQAALPVYHAALALRPDHPATLYNLANALLATDDAAAAEQKFRAALILAPDHAGCHNNLGNALRRLGRHAEAVDAYRAALPFQAKPYGTLNNLGAALLSLHRPEAALAALGDSLQHNPDFAEAHNNLGGALLALGRAEEAIAAFRRAVELDGAHVQARLGLGIALLTCNALPEGFAQYEARWLDARFSEDLRPYAAPLWLGSPCLSGKTLLVHHEQGLGDTIQFVRYLPLLRARGVRVLLEVPPSLLRLLAPLADEAVAAGADLPPHDARIPLLSLPLALRTAPDTVPGSSPYLCAAAAPPDLRGPGLNVALTLSGSAEHPEDVLRSIPASLLLPLLTVPGISWHVVQTDLLAADAAALDGVASCRVHGPALTDFYETASLLAAMDLCISVDTAVAHLAGALARPVWVLLQHAADFRWLRERPDSPWYPTARLFRQTAERRWEPVVADVAAALRSSRHLP